jgi:hypothetical protein
LSKSFAYLCLINGFYDLLLGIMFLVAGPQLAGLLGLLFLLNIYGVFLVQCLGVCLLALGLGLLAAYRNLEHLLIIPLMKIVAHFGTFILGLYYYFVIALPLTTLVIPIISAIFGLLLLVFMLTTKGSFSAAFKAAPTKK